MLGKADKVCIRLKHFCVFCVKDNVSRFYHVFRVCWQLLSDDKKHRYGVTVMVNFVVHISSTTPLASRYVTE